MHELLTKLLQGVDPTDPGAFWQIFSNMMLLVPWWWLFWSNVVCVAVGVGIAYLRRSSITRAVGWALVLGPFAWLITWYAKTQPRQCPRCGASAVPARQRCAQCGCMLNAKTPAPPTDAPE